MVRDLYTEGSGGTVLQHPCCIVDDLDSAIDRSARAGYAEASLSLPPLGRRLQ